MMVIDASVWVGFFVKQDVNHAITHDWLTNILPPSMWLSQPVLESRSLAGIKSILLVLPLLSPPTHPQPNRPELLAQPDRL